MSAGQEGQDPPDSRRRGRHLPAPARTERARPPADAGGPRRLPGGLPGLPRGFAGRGPRGLGGTAGRPEAARPPPRPPARPVPAPGHVGMSALHRPLRRDAEGRAGEARLPGGPRHQLPPHDALPQAAPRRKRRRLAGDGLPRHQPRLRHDADTPAGRASCPGCTTSPRAGGRSRRCTARCRGRFRPARRRGSRRSAPLADRGRALPVQLHRMPAARGAGPGAGPGPARPCPPAAARYRLTATTSPRRPTLASG